VGVLVALALLSPRALPYNMDEFVHYHALGCATAPLSQDLPSFRDGCGLYDLRLPFTETWLPLRSYYYIGSLPAVPFYPLWLLLDDPVAARVQGALFLVAFVVLTARLLGTRPRFVLLACLVFPVFVVTFLVDQGPVGISIVLLLVALVAVRRAVASGPRGAVAWATLAGLTCFAGLWVKLVFAWWLPALALFAVAQVRQDLHGTGAARPHLRLALLAGALTLVLPTVVLLASVDVDGRSYGAALSRGRLSANPADLAAGAYRLSQYLSDASRLAPRNVTLPPSMLDVIPLALSMVILAVVLRRSGSGRRDIAGWLLLGLVTFVLASTSGFTQWPHHFVFPAVFLVLALAKALQTTGRPAWTAAVVCVVVVWASLGVRWSGAVYPRTSSPEKDELLTCVRAEGLDRRALQVHSSWGTYYIAQLFGDRERMVVFVKGIPDDAVQLREVACLAWQHGRRVLLISARRWSRIQTTTVTEVLGRPDETWRFGGWWAVVYDADRPEACGSVAEAGRGPMASTMQSARRSAISSSPFGLR
jgi:hypothetical protein